jgi:RNA polymerase sigma factor (sigma-70 family)
MINAKDHFGLVGCIAKKYVELHKGEKIEDTDEFSDGLVGLTKAMQIFEPERGFQFSTFAYYCIRSAICKGIKERQRSVRPKIRIDFNDTSIDIPDRPNKPNFERIAQSILRRFPDDTIKDRENKRIVIDYYLHGKLLKEIGQEYGVSKERIRQRREQGLKRLRKAIGVTSG